jgi:hypothetical protein
MRAKQAFFLVLLIGVVIYFGMQLVPTLERLADEGLTIVVALLLILGIGYLVYRVISA